MIAFSSAMSPLTSVNVDFFTSAAIFWGSKAGTVVWAVLEMGAWVPVALGSVDDGVVVAGILSSGDGGTGAELEQATKKKPIIDIMENIGKICPNFLFIYVLYSLCIELSKAAFESSLFLLNSPVFHCMIALFDEVQRMC